MAHEYRDYHELAFSRAERILTVGFNRPERANAVNAQMHSHLPWPRRVAILPLRVLRPAGRQLTGGDDTCPTTR